MSDNSSMPTNFYEASSLYSSYCNYLMDDQLDGLDFDISDFISTEAVSEENSSSNLFESGASGASGASTPVLSEQINQVVVEDVDNKHRTNCNMQRKSKKIKMDVGSRVAFRMKSEIEIIDDGYKWRKYGKKSVKNSPNPRNYYRCNHEGCSVKKRVERDRNDSSYVITTYDGAHSHESPSIVYYNEMPLMVPNGWTLQSSSS